MTIQCCKCHKVKAGSEWTHPAVSANEPVSHSYCPDCFTQTRAEMRAERMLSLMSRTPLLHAPR